MTVAEEKSINMDDFQIYKELKKNLSDDCSQLESRKKNLESIVSDLQKRNESERKFIDQEKNNIFTKERSELQKYQAKLDEKASDLERREKYLDDRQKNIEQHEALLGDVNLKKAELMRDKSDFLSYKDKIEADLEFKKAEMIELDGKYKAISVEEDRLRGTETSLKERSAYIDKELGLLNEAKKEFESYKKNVLEPTVSRETNIKIDKKEKADVKNRLSVSAGS